MLVPHYHIVPLDATATAAYSLASMGAGACAILEMLLLQQPAEE